MDRTHSVAGLSSLDDEVLLAVFPSGSWSQGPPCSWSPREDRIVFEHRTVAADLWLMELPGSGFFDDRSRD
jgi:hypothetical protein